jgi:hypothetical protein
MHNLEDSMETEKTETLKPYVVQIDGGIGRVICSIPAIEKLSKSKKVIVITSHPEVFWHNPYVYKVYGLGREYLWDDVIKHGEYLYPEPYFNYKYYNQEHHLIQSFDMLLNGGSGKFYTPKLYLTKEELSWATDFIQARRKDSGKQYVAMFQCTGSSAKLVDGNIEDTTNRSLPINIIKSIVLNSDCVYINASNISFDMDNIWNQNFTLRELFALTACSDFIVGVDSYLMHVGAAFNKVGMVFFGGTYPQNLGYSNYRMAVREGFPKTYLPNRFSGFIDENKGALDFDSNELEVIIKTINTRNFPTVEEVFPIANIDVHNVVNRKEDSIVNIDNEDTKSEYIDDVVNKETENQS